MFLLRLARRSLLSQEQTRVEQKDDEKLTFYILPSHRPHEYSSSSDLRLESETQVLHMWYMHTCSCTRTNHSGVTSKNSEKDKNQNRSFQLSKTSKGIDSVEVAAQNLLDPLH